MGIHSQWYNDTKTIIHREMSLTWTWDEYTQNSKQEYLMVEAVQHPVTLIIDASQSLTLPVGSLSYFKQELEECSEKSSKQIVVSNNGAFWTLYRILIQMVPQSKGHFFIVRTPQEAYQLAEGFIQEPTLL